MLGGKLMKRAETKSKPKMASEQVDAEATRVGNVVGADPHKRTVTATVLDERGGILGTAAFKVSTAGHQEMEQWALSFGPINRWGLEGAAGIGRHTAIHLIRQGHDVRDVCPNRTNERAKGRRQGKSDALDSVRIARETQADPTVPVAFKRAGDDRGPDQDTELMASPPSPSPSSTSRRRTPPITWLSSPKPSDRPLISSAASRPVPLPSCLSKLETRAG